MKTIGKLMEKLGFVAGCGMPQSALTLVKTIGKPIETWGGGIRGFWDTQSAKPLMETIGE